MKHTNPNSVPPIPPALIEYAQKSGQKLIHVSLANKPPIEKLMAEGMSAIEGGAFWAVADFAPRIGEIIRTQNGKLCKITLVAHSVVSFDLDKTTKGFMLIPWVAAVLDEKESAQ
jgi:hypothetical protein